MCSMIHREEKNKEKAAEKILEKTADAEDVVVFDRALRPKNLADYVGQRKIKNNLRTLLTASQKRGDGCEHILLHGPAGLGKTTLAFIVAEELNVSLKLTSGPALERAGDLAAILTNLKEHEVLFIDEIHRLKPTIQEVLYSAMEDFGIDIVIGKGPSARSVRLELPRFTLIGATTKVSALSSPLRDRFGVVYKLQFYEMEEIEKIVQRSAKLLETKLDISAAKRLAQSSRRTPRIANRLLRRVRDHAEVHGDSTISNITVEETFKSLGVDELGLDAADRELLIMLIEKFKGGPVGLNTIASALSEEEGTIEDIYEPYLLQLGFLERTARGRKATEHAYKHVGLDALFSKHNPQTSIS
jgi:holliday junction DNA helicase RuvB